MKSIELLHDDLYQIENVLIELEKSSDIWQNRVVKILCRTVWHILTYLVKVK